MGNGIQGQTDLIKVVVCEEEFLFLVKEGVVEVIAF